MRRGFRQLGGRGFALQSEDDMDRKERCETCRWWDQTFLNEGEESYEGECHRNAPIPSYKPVPEQPMTWPETHKADFCGEWTPTTLPTLGLDTTPESAEELKRDIQAVLKQLNYREREVIKLRYGLGDGIIYTLEECGHIFKVTRERIRAIERKAITKLGMMPGADKLLERCSKLQQAKAVK